MTGLRIGELCRLLDLPHRQVKYVLECVNPPGRPRRGKKGKNLAFTRRQALWMGIVCYLRQSGVKTQAAADMATEALEVESDLDHADFYYKCVMIRIDLARLREVLQDRESLSEVRLSYPATAEPIDEEGADYGEEKDDDQEVGEATIIRHPCCGQGDFEEQSRDLQGRVRAGADEQAPPGNPALERVHHGPV